ncbi:hypothetical protein H0A36_22845 [Endozoicomonas sp. SM1973]|uniref:Methyltransferase type 11 domain-containing protein n=1 Tax=Spartinivicinus marinus TaxID=2994442 RepID=A0A853IFV7_9GAMM|nr:hypothetical protein [Spartinivicinus marinus]MCX4025869.1 hypothetical protein [Spartinivicinus marinus]NYZ68861.1 hypothetical protein [Spartinivicinus marinus]
MSANQVRAPAPLFARRLSPHEANALKLCNQLLKPISPFKNGLEFSNGDEWFGQGLIQNGITDDVAMLRWRQHPPVSRNAILYNGRMAPLPSQSFELTCAIDVLHHSRDPKETLRDLLRLTKQYCLIKDYTYSHLPSWFLVALEDMRGNRKLQTNSTLHYQHKWEWLKVFDKAGFTLVELKHPVGCDGWPKRIFTKRVQFIGLWERK